MSASELAAQVAAALDVDPETFQSRAAEEAERLKEEVGAGTFDNTQAIVGLELELYGVDDRTDALQRMPRDLLDLIGFEKELGLHNAEMQTSPQPLNSYGLAAQVAELQANLAPAQERTSHEDIRLVSDGLWTVPPTGETARSYLCDSVEEQGVRLATNMSDAVRYHVMANADYPAGMRLDAPHVSLQADTVMPESLITSIQPHYQIPHAPDLPEYFSYALRVAGPLLALGVNSPFFPPDLYDDAPDPDIVADAHVENRVRVFETVLNPADADARAVTNEVAPAGDGVRPKVRFPPDFETVEDAVDDVLADHTVVPMDVAEGDRFDDAIAHFRHKHGSYWRWIRPVFDGASRSAANARIEFRPLPGQPTIRDAVAFQAVFAGLMEALPQIEHPIQGLDWATAKENFYAATRDGLRADVEWITVDGTHTTDTDELYDELFELAREGLEGQGLSSEAASQYVRPLRERVDRRLTPARWKHDQVREAVEENVPLAEAIWGMQSRYIDRQAESLLEGRFVDWL